jgi:hypothetical protein
LIAARSGFLAGRRTSFAIDAGPTSLRLRACPVSFASNAEGRLPIQGDATPQYGWLDRLAFYIRDMVFVIAEIIGWMVEGEPPVEPIS